MSSNIEKHRKTSKISKSKTFGQMIKWDQQNRLETLMHLRTTPQAWPSSAMRRKATRSLTVVSCEAPTHLRVSEMMDPAWLTQPVVPSGMMIYDISWFFSPVKPPSIPVHPCSNDTGCPLRRVAICNRPDKKSAAVLASKQYTDPSCRVVAFKKMLASNWFRRLMRLRFEVHKTRRKKIEKWVMSNQTSVLCSSW